MGRGKILYFKSPTRKTLFPVTRVEAVLARGTTLDKVLSEHDTQISQLREDVDNIGSVTNAEVEAIVNEHWGAPTQG